MIYKLVSSWGWWGPQFRSPRWHKSPWVSVHSGWSPHQNIKQAHTQTHTHTQYIYFFHSCTLGVFYLCKMDTHTCCNCSHSQNY